MDTQLTTITTTRDDSGVVDIEVQSEVTTEDELVVTLLTVVEKLTGVSADNYVTEVDTFRRSAS